MDQTRERQREQRKKKKNDEEDDDDEKKIWSKSIGIEVPVHMITQNANRKNFYDLVFIWQCLRLHLIGDAT